MISWVFRHLLETLLIGFGTAGALLAYGFRRLWPVLIPVPAVLAGLAWNAWEFSSEAGPIVVAMLVAGWVGIGLGAILRRDAARSS
jgi:hypothetical protein